MGAWDTRVVFEREIFFVASKPLFQRGLDKDNIKWVEQRQATVLTPVILEKRQI